MAKTSSKSKSKSGAKKSAGKTSGKNTGVKSKNEILIVASKMKDAIRNSGFNVAGDAIHHLNERVHAILQGAVHRANTNGRKTVRGHDF